MTEVTKGFSLISLDAGKYVKELDNYTFYGDTALYYFLYIAIFYAFINIFISVVNKKIKKINIIAPCSPIRDWRYTVINIVGYLGVLYMIFDMAISGIPLLSHGSIDRYNYWSSYSTLPMAKYVSLMLTIICVALGFQFASQKLENKKSKKWLILLIAIFLIRILLGYKASGIIDLILGFTIGYLYRISIFRKVSLKKILGLVVLIYLVIICFYCTSQIIYGKYANVGEALGAIFGRFFLSGQMEWSVLSDPTVRGSLWVNNYDELLSVFCGGNDMDPNIGVYGLMNEYAPFETYNLYFERSVRFVSGFIAVSLYYNGIVFTIMLCALNALIFSIFYLIFKKCSIYNYILTFTLVFYVYNLFTTYLDGSGTLTSFWNLNTYMYIIFIYVLSLIEKEYVHSIWSKQSMDRLQI